MERFETYYFNNFLKILIILLIYNKFFLIFHVSRFKNEIRIQRHVDRKLILLEQKRSSKFFKFF